MAFSFEAQRKNCYYQEWNKFIISALEQLGQEQNYITLLCGLAGNLGSNYKVHS